MKTISVRLSAGVHKRLKESAELAGRSMSEQMTYLVDRSFWIDEMMWHIAKVIQQKEG